MIAIDAPVLVQLLTDGPQADAAEACLRQCLGNGRVVVCDAALAELCAALRNGAEKVTLVYRRSRDEMPAEPYEIEEAEHEGVEMMYLTAPTKITLGPNGVKQLHCLRMELGEPDRSGRRRPVPVEGSDFVIEADTIIGAIGQSTDTGFLYNDLPVRLNKWGDIDVDGRTMKSSESKIFAGGDMVPAQRTVTVGVGHGKRAARNIDAWLRGVEQAPPPRHELASFDTLNPWYYSDAPRSEQPRLEAARRTTGFEEVVRGLDESNALFEARRCMSCGNCFSCDNCYGVCPDNAVIKLGAPGERYEIDLDYCKGCGLCAAECPCGAIEMVPEQI